MVLLNQRPDYPETVAATVPRVPNDLNRGVPEILYLPQGQSQIGRVIRGVAEDEVFEGTDPTLNQTSFYYNAQTDWSY